MHKTLLVLAVLATLPLFAQSPKEPWKLTVEERIALRTNPELARERVQAANRRQASARIQTSSARAGDSDARPDVDAFDGKTHPELFLPSQVFDQFIKMAFRHDARKELQIQRALTPDIMRLGLPADFWTKLRSVSTVFIADSWGERDIGQSLHKLSGSQLRRAKEALKLKQTDICRSRAEALAAAREEFGAERFDRLLYQVMAVNMFSVADRLPDPELLRHAERGCR